MLQGGWVCGGEDGVVDNATLETFAVRERLGVIDLMKLDAAGGELAILAGGRSLLERGAIRSLICKLYHPDVVAERFGRDRGPVAIVDFLSLSKALLSFMKASSWSASSKA